MAKTINDELERTDSAFEHDIFGSFPFSTVNVYSTHDWTIAAGDTITFTADSGYAGTAGDSLYVRALADGSAKACIDCDIDAGCANLDTIIQAKTGGTAYNSWSLQLVPHSILGGGVSIYEDTANGVLVISFEASVSKVSDVETALSSCTLFETKTSGTAGNTLTTIGDAVAICPFAGGTAATYVTWGTSNPHLTVHFTNGVTTVTALKTAVNTSVTNKSMTASSTGTTHTIATADAFVAVGLSSGVDAVALDTSLIKGNGFSVARTGASGTGEYTVTFTELWKGMKFARASIQQHSNTAYSVQVGNYTAASKTVVLRCVNYSGAVDPTPGSNQAIHFAFTMLTQ